MTGVYLEEGKAIGPQKELRKGLAPPPIEYRKVYKTLLYHQKRASEKNVIFLGSYLRFETLRHNDQVRHMRPLFANFASVFFNRLNLINIKGADQSEKIKY